MADRQGATVQLLFLTVTDLQPAVNTEVVDKCIKSTSQQRERSKITNPPIEHRAILHDPLRAVAGGPARDERGVVFFLDLLGDIGGHFPALRDSHAR